MDELNDKLRAHLRWSNNKTMRTLGHMSPLEKLAAVLAEQSRHD